MPPRISVPRALPGSFVTQRTSRPILSFLVPALQQQPTVSQQATAVRSASILTSLSDNRTAYGHRIRRGRGPSSGKGKTSGRGHKGQKQHGKVPAGFEGGQTPLHIVHGERGFTNVFTADLQTVPLSRILSWIAQGRLDPTLPITVRELALSNCVSNIKDGVKLLASSKHHDLSIDEIPALTQPLHIVVSRASAQAIAAVEAAGGQVTTRYYTRWAIQRIIRGTMDPMVSLQSQVPESEGGGTITPREMQAQSLSQDAAAAVPETQGQQLQQPSAGATFLHRLPDATSRKAIEYYRDPAKRGYLSYQLQEGENPSLYFKSVEETMKWANAGQNERKKLKASEENRLF